MRDLPDSTLCKPFGRSSRARLLAAAVFLGAAGASVPFLTPAIAQVFAFSTVRIEGNSRVDAATILSYAGIARGQEVSAGGLNDAYQRLARSGLFETVELVPQGSTLVIRVTEYPFVNIINFEGNKRLKDEELAGIVQSQSRKVYSPSTAEADAAAIAEIYRIRGRLAATVTPKIIRRDGNRVDLVFEITEGKVVEIERLSFVGNKAFSDRRLRQVLETKQAGFLRALIQRDTFVAERLEVDKQVLTDFYRSRGYIDFQVTDASAETARERDATFVTFTVREGLPYHNRRGVHRVRDRRCRCRRIRGGAEDPQGPDLQPGADREQHRPDGEPGPEKGPELRPDRAAGYPRRPQPGGGHRIRHRQGRADLRRADRHRRQRHHAGPGGPPPVPQRGRRPLQPARNPPVGRTHPRAGLFLRRQGRCPAGLQPGSGGGQCRCRGTADRIAELRPVLQRVLGHRFQHLAFPRATFSAAGRRWRSAWRTPPTRRIRPSPLPSPRFWGAT